MSNGFHQADLSLNHPACAGDDSLDFLREAEAALERGDTQKARQQYRVARGMKSDNALVVGAQEAGLTRLLDALEHGFGGLTDVRTHSLTAQRMKHSFADVH